MKKNFSPGGIAILLILLSGLYKPSFAQVIITPGVHLTTDSGTYLVLANSGLVGNGIINHNSGTIKFSGSDSNFISGTGITSFYNIELVKPAGTSLILLKNIGIRNQLTFASGLLNLNNYEIDLFGTGFLLNEREISRTIGSTGGKIKTNIVLNAPNAANPGNLGAVFSSTENFGNVTIERGHQSQMNDRGTGTSILRFYEITPTNNAALKATLRFNYFDAELNGIAESNLVLFKGSSNGSWVEKGYTTRDAATNYVEKINNPDFSRWTLSNAANSLASGCPDSVPTQNYYADLDGDGYGNPNNIVASCTQPAGYVTNKTDCNDDPAAGGAAIYPGVTEICNGIDDDCDGQVDEGVQTVYYPDVDGDGYGNTAASVKSCSPPSGYIATGGDCNDNNANVKPGGGETCGNNIDDNCNGQIDEGCTVTIPSLSINSIVVDESTGTAQLTVTLSAPAAATVRVKYKTLNGTALHPKDFLRVTGELVFAPGVTTQFINITVVSDNKPEVNEYLDVELNTPEGATINNGIGRITITENSIVMTDGIQKQTSSSDEMQTAGKYFTVDVSSNPAKHEFGLLVRSSATGKIVVQVKDILGRQVQQLEIKSPSIQLYLGSNYHPGMYIAHITQGDNRKVVKLVKL